MFSSACQGLQLCLEPKVIESHFLRLKLAPQISNFSGTIETPTEPDSMSYNEEEFTNSTNNNSNSNDCKLIGNQNTDMGCWSFIQSLAGAKDSTDHNEIYVHPLVKSSPSTLTEQSLELCTESLGSETGTKINDDIPFLSSEAIGCNALKPRENAVVTRGMSRSSSFPPPLTSISGSTLGCNPSSEGRENMVIRRMNRSSSFPPPLTSISGSNGVQVMSHREGGRLVLQAVNVPSCKTYLHAERSEGRLRLCLLKDTTLTTPILDDEDRKDDEEEQERGEEIVEEDELVEDIVHEENVVVEDYVVYKQNGVYEENDVVEDEVEEEKYQWGDEDVDGKNENVGGEIGKRKLARPCSCKERGCGRKGLLDWEPYLVAT